MPDFISAQMQIGCIRTKGQSLIYPRIDFCNSIGIAGTDLIDKTIFPQVGILFILKRPFQMPQRLDKKRNFKSKSFGSLNNIFNLLFILGVSATIHPIAVNYASAIDLLILIVVSIAQNRTVLIISGV